MTELSSAQASIQHSARPFEGARIPGGCTDCDAYQTTEALEDGVWKVTVHHDDGCPVLKRIEKARNL